MQAGISSYTFTWAVGVPGSIPAKPLNAYDLVKRAATLKVGVIQIADNLPLEMLSIPEIQNLKSYADLKNVSIEMGSRKLTPEHTIQCLDTAVVLNSSILRMVIDGQDFEPELSSVIAIIKDLLPEIKKRNIKLAIENHDRFRAREFEKIVLKTDPEIIGICLDSVNSMGAGEGFETVSEILGQYTINLHVKDFVIYRMHHKMGFIIEGRPAGRGMLNIPELINKLNSYGSCQSAILELWTPPEDNIEKTLEKENEWALESIKYLNTLIK